MLSTRNSVLWAISRRCMSHKKAAVSTGFQTRMSGWELHEYGDFNDVLELQTNLRIPKVNDPKEMIVRVRTASVNPIDLAMSAGYGASLLNVLRGTDQELPLRLGRDFCGEIIYRGVGVDRTFATGDLIWGVVPPHQPGSLAELVKVHQDHVMLKPKALTAEEAGVVPYAGLTAWSGLFLSGNLGGCGIGNQNSKAAGKKVLILGASGGVGTMAVQICRAENCHVVATGSGDAEELVKSLGADDFLDYNRVDDYEAQLREAGPWDIILDCAGRGSDEARSHGWQFKNYVTFSSPLLRNIGAEGLVSGALKSVDQILTVNFRGRQGEGSVGQGLVKWGYFVAHPRGLQYLRNLAEGGKLKPVISHRVGYTDLPKAFELLRAGHLRGKIAVNGF